MRLNVKSVKHASLLLIAGFMGACSTLGSVGDAINPFDESEAQRRARQGEVAGENERISLLSAQDTLSVSADAAPPAVTLPASYVNADWPQSGGNITHAMQMPAASGEFKRAWSKSVGKGSGRKGRVVASPVVSSGTIFAMDGGNKVMALDASSGKKKWDYKVEVELAGRTREGRDGIFEQVSNPLSLTDRGGKDRESVGGGIAAADGKLFVTSGLGVIDALDAATGERVWRKRLTTPMHSAPTVSGGRLFAITDDNELMALNSATGDVLWTYQGIIESARMLTSPSPAVIDDVVLAPFASGELIALRVQNGVVLWSDTLTASGTLTPLSGLNDIAAGPVIADGYVIATAQSGIINAFDLRTGQRVWTQPGGSLGYPWVAGDFVYMVTTNGELTCLSKISGEVVWLRKLPTYKNEKKRKSRIAWSGPIMAGERLLVVSSQGKAAQFNPYTGEPVGEFKTGGDIFISPIIAGETVYMLDNKAKLSAYR